MRRTTGHVSKYKQDVKNLILLICFLKNPFAKKQQKIKYFEKALKRQVEIMEEVYTVCLSYQLFSFTIHFI